MNQDELMGRKVRQLREDWGESQTDLARIIGYSRVAVSRYESGERPISLKTLQKVANHYGVPMTYFLGRDTDEGKAAAEFKRLAEEIERLHGEVKETLIRLPGGTIDVPIYGAIPAGWPDDVEQQPLGSFPVPESILHCKDAFWLVVCGSSLKDAGIDDGDLILIDPGADWQNGQIIAVRLETGESVVRRAYREDDRIRLQAANPQYEVLRVTNAQVYGRVTIVHKVVK